MKRKVVGYREVRAHTSLALLRIDSLVLLRAQCIALIHGTAALRLHPTDEARDKVPSPQTPEIITVGTPPPGPEPTRVTPPGFEIQRATDRANSALMNV